MRSKEFSKSLIWCEKKESAPDLHKSLSGPVWKESRKVELSGKLATSAYLLRSRDGLYIGFRCMTGDGKKPRGEKRERDGWMFAHGDDIVSVFIDEKHNHLEYYQFALNAYGTQYDARRTASGGIEDKGWNGTWKADAMIYDGYWEAKFFIPFSDLGIKPKEGDTLGINLSREERCFYSVWAPVERHFHEPDNFGTLFLGAKEDMPGTVDHGETVGSIQRFQSAPHKLCGEAVMKKGEFFEPNILDGKYWSFLNGSWSDGNEGELISPRDDSLPHGAFWLGQAFSDFNAEFEVQFGFPGSGGARFFFRVQDATKYYAFDLPFCGQQVRTRAVWGLIAKGDGNGLDQYLKLFLLQRVIPEYDRWYAVRVEASGGEFRMWVDGEPLPPVRDESYVSGFVGIGSYGGMAVFRNLRIAGKTCEFEKLPKEVSVPNLAFIPWKTSKPEKQEQSGGSFCRTDEGEILCAFSSGGHACLSRSRDGRRWTSPEPLPKAGVSYIRSGTAGDIILQIWNGESMLRYESHDNGHTWSAPLSAHIDVPETVDSLHPGSGRSIREMPDGSLVTFWFGPVKKSLSGGNGHSGITTWGKVAWQAFCLRSTDGGRSWGKPVNLDKTLGSLGKYVEPRQTECNYDLTEVDGGWVEGNRCLAFIRPVYLPWMWESWSEDGGKTWGPAKIGPFPGWVPTFLRMRDGKLIVIHRYPYLTTHVSLDGGRRWSNGTRISWMDDGVTGMFETEPGRILILCSGKGNGGLLRGIFVRVESNGVFPE